MGSLSPTALPDDSGLSELAPGWSILGVVIDLAAILRPSLESHRTKLLSSCTVSTKIPLGCQMALVSLGLRGSWDGTSQFPPNAPGGTSYSKYFCARFCLNENVTAPSGYPTRIFPISRGEKESAMTGQKRARGLRWAQRLGTLKGVKDSRSRSYAMISPTKTS